MKLKNGEWKEVDKDTYFKKIKQLAKKQKKEKIRIKKIVESIRKEKHAMMSTFNCDKCGRKLPRRGTVWAGRYDQSKEFRAEHNERSGYLCDSCANDREEGWE